MSKETQSETKKDWDRAGAIIGGTTLIGLAVGFVFLSRSPLYFVACILGGVGIGLVVSSLIRQ